MIQIVPQAAESIHPQIGRHGAKILRQIAERISPVKQLVASVD